MSDSQSWTVQFRGNPALARLAEQVFRENGLQVRFEAPSEEERNLVTDVLITIVAQGAYDAMKAAFRKLRQRMPDRDLEVDPPLNDETGDSEE